MAISYVRTQGIPVGRSDRPAIAWYGDMDFVAHFRRIIAQGAMDVVVRFGEPIPFGPESDRKQVAEQCYQAVRRMIEDTRTGRSQNLHPGQVFSPSAKEAKGTRGAPGRYAGKAAPGGRQPGFMTTSRSNRKVHIRTYGCQMNVYDSERMADALAEAGYAPVDSPEEADLILLNTCHIREKAAEKVYSEIGRLRGIKTRARAEGRSVTIGVAGCVAQAEGEEIMRRAPRSTWSSGRSPTTGCPTWSRRRTRAHGSSRPTFRSRRSSACSTGSCAGRAPERAGDAARRYAAFLTVQEGCDKFCTFCVVPYTRGAEVSRPVEAIVAEASGSRPTACARSRCSARTSTPSTAKARTGATGASAGSSSGSRKFPGIDRLRYTTSHPRDMDDDLIAAHRDLTR